MNEFPWNKERYAELLKCAEWRIKREDVLEAGGYVCAMCNSTEQLQVHHKYYIPGVRPWEYADDCYEVLCDTCHKSVTKARRDSAWRLVRALQIIGIDPYDVNHVADKLMEAHSWGATTGKTGDDLYYTLLQFAAELNRNKSA